MMFLEAFFWGDTNKREGRKFDELGKLIKKNQERKDKEDKQREIFMIGARRLG